MHFATRNRGSGIPVNEIPSNSSQTLHRIEDNTLFASIRLKLGLKLRVTPPCLTSYPSTSMGQVLSSRRVIRAQARQIHSGPASRETAKNVPGHVPTNTPSREGRRASLRPGSGYPGTTTFACTISVSDCTYLAPIDKMRRLLETSFVVFTRTVFVKDDTW